MKNDDYDPEFYVENNPYVVVPIHKRKDLYDDTVELLNDEWDRRAAHLRSLKLSCTTLPLCMILYQEIDGDEYVLAHLKLSAIPRNPDACVMEYLVVDPDFRNMGLGMLLIAETEEYCSYYLNLKTIYVATEDKNVFFAKCGYALTKPINLFGIRARSTRGVTSKKIFLKKELEDWIAKEQHRIEKETSDAEGSDFYEFLRRKKELLETLPPPESNDPYIVVPIHNHKFLLEQCVTLINSEWPRSRMARLWSLESSKDDLPTSLVLTQTIRNKTIVLAHVKLSEVPCDPEAVFVESVVVDKRYRGRGIGKHLMKETEKYCSDYLHLKKVYLSTQGQEVFYSKLGYDFCKPINLFSVKQAENTSTKKKFMLKELSGWLSDENYKVPELPVTNGDQKAVNKSQKELLNDCFNEMLVLQMHQI